MNTNDTNARNEGREQTETALRQKIAGVFTAKRLKAAGIAAAVLLALGGGAAWGVHAFEAARHTRAQAMQQEITQRVVEERNAKSQTAAQGAIPLAAENGGAPPATQQAAPPASDGQQPPVAPPPAPPAATPAAPAATQPLLTPAEIRAIVANTIGKSESELAFHELYLKDGYDGTHRYGGRPIYKVECYAGSVFNRIEYEFHIDAASGAILKSEVDYD